MYALLVFILLINKSTVDHQCLFISFIVYHLHLMVVMVGKTKILSSQMTGIIEYYTLKD